MHSVNFPFKQVKKNIGIPISPNFSLWNPLELHYQAGKDEETSKQHARAAATKAVAAWLETQ